MSAGKLDKTKEQLRHEWAHRGPFWNKRADEIADMAARLNEPFLDAADIAPGHRVLDLASGAGEPALTIARRVGDSGSVVASDMVPEMLAGARRRAAAAGIGNITFEIADMEALPFDESGFDRVTCRFGLMFSVRPEQALAEARRVLVPGGRAAFMVWGPRDETTIFAVFATAAATVFGDDPEIDVVTPFRFAEAGSLAATMTAAGLVDVEERALRFAPRVPASGEFWHPMQDMMLGRTLAGASEDERAALRRAVRAGLAPTREGDDYHLSLHARIGLGRRPER